MTKRSVWSELPNAQHIDRIIAHVKANPGKWTTAGYRDGSVAYGAAYDAAYDAASDTASEAAYFGARDAVRDAARDAAWDAAMGAILALIAWDDCAYLLDQKPEHIHLMALLGHQAAILFEPAVVAMYEEQMETV